MKTLWICFIVMLLFNAVLASLDYLSTTLGSPFILMIFMALLTIGAGVALILNSANKMKASAIVISSLLISHYKVTAMLFAMLIWSTRGFAP